jgi:hypothetical protein
MPTSLFTRKKTNTKHSTKLKAFFNKTDLETKDKIMENSMKILNTVKDLTKPTSKCPKGITKKMLLIELDCEDLRSRQDTIHEDELWTAYCTVNTNVFRAFSEKPEQNKKHISHPPIKSLIKPKI